ncbi:RNA polymerase sigma factor [Streptomyces sp. NBC_01304]|uniref:RNA polymerase sigma factor n=1 Tax=Streptomyces sp. NBC_01304 TaxID=2903818 RepID=UPI003FA3C71A
MLRRLTPREASAFRMVFQGHPVATVASEMGISEQGVQGLLHRARNKLRHSDVLDVVDEFRAADAGRARQEVPPLTRHCAQCQAQFELHQPSPGQMHGGRPRLFCSNACRQTAYRNRKAAAEATPQPDSTSPPVPSRPQRVRTRLSVCHSSTGGDLGDDCLLFPGHEGLHRTLVDLDTTPRWASWQAAPPAHDSNLWEAPTACKFQPVCTAAPQLTLWCLLPEGHTGVHAFSEPPQWMSGPTRWRYAPKRSMLSRSVISALRVRISPGGAGSTDSGIPVTC